MNQKLFDECTQQYKLEQKKEKERLKLRGEAWEKIESRARENPDLEKVSSLMCNLTLRPPADNANDVMDGVEESSEALHAKIEEEASKAAAEGTTMGSAFPASKKNMDKPLLRKKSELPRDIYTQNALDSHKRVDEFLPTPPDGSKA
jgi:serine/threonine-protein phosphatase 2A regulatory subunit B'